MANIVLSAKNQLDSGTTLYGAEDAANPLTNMTNSVFSSVWRYTPGTNADGNTAKFAMSLNPVALASHLVLSRHNMGEAAQIRVRAGMARLDADFTSDAPTFATPSEITFGGGANGTRTNEYGVMVAGTCPRYEHDRRYLENGFTYSEDLTNPAWLELSGCKKYTDGKTVDFAQAGAVLYQAMPDLYGDTYEVKAQVRVVSGSGDFAFRIGNGTVNTTGTTQTATSDWEWFSDSITVALSSVNNDVAGIQKVTAAGVLQIRKAQICRGASSGKYRKTTSARRYRRIQLITEAAATNSQLWSAEWNNASWWTSSITVTPNSAVAPDGTSSMDTITATGAAGTIYQTLSFGGTTKRAISFFFQKSGSTSTDASLLISWITGGVSQQARCNFNPSTGAFVSSSTPVGAPTVQAAGVKDLGGGYYRAYLVATGTDPANTQINAGVLIATNGQSIVAWGYQNEANYVTTYIPTTSAAVTRTVDTGEGETATWVPLVLNTAEGTLYVELQPDEIPADSSRTVHDVEIYNSGADSRIRVRLLYTSGTGYQVQIIVVSAGVTLWTSTATTVSANAVARIAVRYRASDFAASVNGATVQTAAVVVPSGLNRIDFMRNTANTSGLRRVWLAQTGKSNADLVSLATSGPSAIDYDSGWDDVLQMTMRGDVSSTWGHDYPIVKTFSARAVEWVRVELYDPAKTSASTPSEIGRAFMGKTTLQPTRNAEYGLGNGWIERTTFTQAHDGRKFFNALPRIREVAFAFPFLTDDERDTWHEIQGAGGIEEEVLYLPDPDDEAECQRYGFVGLLESLDPLKHHMVAQHSMSGQICQKR